MNLVYILGAGHCGSTLLSLALDQHPQVVAVSELINLNRKLPGQAGEQHVVDEPFWNAVADRYYAISSKSL